ncbi:MAG TPA: M20/M25/M40 family metallo-hydrolase, partial [Anaerolineales bacterium]|nr:M20/M25/M40 family metallo-hydrolase [Anaerolineales bacterium]
VDAITHMGRFLVELEKLGRELLQRPPHPLAGPPSIHASLIEGGSELSVYPARCTLKLERRTLPGETVAQATAELQAIIDRLAAADPAFRATVRPFFDRDPFEVAAGAPVVQALEKAATAVLGQPPAHTGATFWTDAALLAAAGIDTVLIGPIGAGLHSDEEWVEVQSVLDLARILAETAVDFCK